MLAAFPSPAGPTRAASTGQGESEAVATAGGPRIPRFARNDKGASWLPACLLLPLCVFAFAPLVRAPLFSSADGLLHLYRLVEFDQGIRGGMLYPRWASDLLAGYGYPIFIFYAPFLYYLSEAFHLVGLGFADALKAAVGAGMAASVLGMYVFGRELWGRWGGLVAAAAYLYAPYRLVNTYLDGELAQTLAWAWLPWLAWACWRWLRTGQLRYGALATACYAGLIATHSVSAWLATLFLGLALGAVLVARGARPGGMLRLAGFLALGVGLAAPYWLPALAEQGSAQLDRVRIAAYDFHTNLLPLGRTLSTSWAHQYTGYVGVNGPAQLGLVQTLAGVAGLLALGWFSRCKRRLGHFWTGVLFAALAAVGFILMLRPAAVFWEHLPFGRFLQFPDRLLAILAFCVAALAGGLVVPLGRWRGAAPVAAVLAAAALVFGATAKLEVNYLALPGSIGPSQVTEYEQISGAFGTTAKGEFTPRWLGAPPLTSPLIETELTGRLPTIAGAPGVQVAVTKRQPEGLEASVTSDRPGHVELPVAYYPGWAASLNGGATVVQPGSHGLVSVEVPAGQSKVALRFGTSPDRRLADGLGLLAAAVLAALAVARHGQRAKGAAAVLVSAAPMAADTAMPVATGMADARQRRSGLGAGAVFKSAGPLVASAGVLAIGLLFTPGKWDLGNWPVQRAELVSYAGWLQLMGADVHLDGNHLHVSTAFRTGNAANARAVTATVRLMTREVVWAAGSQSMPVAGWITAVPRRLDFDLPLPAGTPAGVYAIEIEVVFDGGVIGPDSARLTYGEPRVGAVTLGPLAIASPIAGAAGGQLPDHADFGPLELVGWQPPANAEQSQLVPINMWWRAKDSTPGGDWGISLHIVDAQGQVWAGHDDQPRLGYNPTSSWQAGELERDVQMALLPHGMPPGKYQVLAGWYDAASGTPVGPQNVLAGQITVAPASHPDARLLDIPHRLQHDFPQGLRLLGYDLPSTHLTVGQDVPLRLFWQATEKPSQDYGVTVWLNGHNVTLPLPATSRWQKGQLMETRLSVPTQSGWAGSGPLGVSLDAGAPEPQAGNA
ncbi:MAG TPA: 6-pyruvoyl-tetrahydropterin synthase-related protein, partial [Chloroflexota bacterium]|nr:6-pyruvoyl-tetrahydropterin synthase-related protein [Chloroflexota bacterium]